MIAMERAPRKRDRRNCLAEIRHVSEVTGRTVFTSAGELRRLGLHEGNAAESIRHLEADYTNAPGVLMMKIKPHRSIVLVDVWVEYLVICKTGKTIIDRWTGEVTEEYTTIERSEALMSTSHGPLFIPSPDQIWEPERLRAFREDREYRRVRSHGTDVDVRWRCKKCRRDLDDETKFCPACAMYEGAIFPEVFRSLTN